MLTPRATDISYQTPFQDYNYTDVLLKDFGSGFDGGNWAPEWDSGYAAATEGTNMTQFISFNGYVLNGTCRKTRPPLLRILTLHNSRLGGVFPLMPPKFDNWTRVEAVQQGLTAEVNCAAAPAFDPDKTDLGRGIIKVSLCCNCTSDSAG